MYSRGHMLAFAVLFVPALAWMGLAMQGGKIVSSEHVRGRVEAVEALPVEDASQSPRFKTSLRLPDGSRAVLILYSNAPEKGALVPVLIQTQADGQRHVRADAR